MRKATSLLSGSIFLVVFTIVSFVLPISCFASSLFSTDFENGSLDNWSSSGGSTTASISAEQKRSGNYALKVMSDKTSSFGYQYAVGGIESGAFYEIGGYGKTDDPNTNSFSLRVAWYKDGSNAQLSSVNESNIVSGSSDWVSITTGTIQAPALATSAKVRLVMTVKIQGQMARVFFDDIVFNEAIAPTSMPTVTSSPTSIPTPTRSPTPIKTPTPTDTESIIPRSLSPTINNKIIPSKVLGTSSKSAMFVLPTATPTKKKPKPTVAVTGIETQKDFLPLFFIGGGILLVIACGILTFQPQLKELWEKILKR